VRRVRSRSFNLLKGILLDILVAQVFLMLKAGYPIPFRITFHGLDIDTHLPIPEMIDDVVNV
jgi:hypothetical protein